MPTVVFVTPHSPALHTNCAQNVLVPHWLPALHSTQPPVPLQKVPPSSEQPEFTSRFGLLGTPSEHTSSVHWLSSLGRSTSLATLRVPPRPLHCCSWQSPAVCPGKGTPTPVGAVPHSPLLQVKVWQNVLVPHCVATLHCTH